MERQGGHGPMAATLDTRPTTIKILPIHDAEPEVLTSFFRAGYGRAYMGDTSVSKKIQRSSHVVMLEDLDRSRRLAGAALIAGRRILTMATSPEPEYIGRRYENAVALFRECITNLQCRWVTIGQEYSRVQEAAYDAGLRRTNDQGLVRDILVEAGEVDNYAFRRDNAGELLVARVRSEFRPDYEQQVWLRPTADT